MSTSKYIYKTLFEEGQGSDVKIIALNKEWNLHRIYLSQSPYFNSMFNGIWVETTQKEINIGIEDGNITTEALHKVFGSLYQDEIQIEPSEAVSILASAAVLQLDDLIQQCTEVMKVSTSIDTALPYYEASELYGISDVKSIALDWLHKNTVLKIATSPTHLSQISVELMTQLLTSPDLVVVQTEFSLYHCLKLWVFLKENPHFKNFDAMVMNAEEYFKSHTTGKPFLETNYGVSYEPAFRALRLKHLIVHHVDIEVIESDNIMPMEWFFPVFKLQWYHMLRIDQGVDKGPKKVTEEDFKKDCVRCGRVLNTDTQHSWRWTGFNFGFDVVIFYSRGFFKLRRYLKMESETRNIYNPVESAASRRDKRRLMYRLSVFSLDDHGQILSQASTPISTVSLTENEQITVLSIQSPMKFPLLVSANFLLTTPLQSKEENGSPGTP